MNKTRLLLSAVALLASAASAAPGVAAPAFAPMLAAPGPGLDDSPGPSPPAGGWLTVGRNPTGEVSVKADSFALGTDASDAPVVLATLRLLNRATHEVIVKKAVVGLSDCQGQAGTLYLANLSDMAVFSRWEFAFGAGNIASSTAEAICGVAAKGLQDAAEAAGVDGSPAPEAARASSPKRPAPDPNEI